VPALFSRFRPLEREAKQERESVKKKERESVKKKDCKKEKMQSAKEKSAYLCFFLPPTLEARFQSPKMLGRGKKGLEQDVQYSMLRYDRHFS
jgi:hypothetical protein